MLFFFNERGNMPKNPYMKVLHQIVQGKVVQGRKTTGTYQGPWQTIDANTAAEFFKGMLLNTLADAWEFRVVRIHARELAPQVKEAAA